jgi:hypothetical protein
MTDMSDLPYTNRELDRMFTTLDDKNLERHKDVMKELGEIKTQTIRTNGRVSRLENWRNWSVGAVTVVVLLVIPLVVYAFNLATEK